MANEKDLNIMDDIVSKAKKSATNKTYKEADDTASKKEGGKAGRKKVSDNLKKKARQVFYSDVDFAEIEECADHLGMDTKSFMQMAINQKVKATLKEIEES